MTTAKKQRKDEADTEAGAAIRCGLVEVRDNRGRRVTFFAHDVGLIEESEPGVGIIRLMRDGVTAIGYKGHDYEALRQEVWTKALLFMGGQYLREAGGLTLDAIIKACARDTLPQLAPEFKRIVDAELEPTVERIMRRVTLGMEREVAEVEG